MVFGFSRKKQDAASDTAARLRDLNAQFAALNRAMAVIEFDLEGRVLSANQNFLDTLGYSLDEIVGQHHRLFVGPNEAKSPEYAQFWQRLARGEYFSGEFRRKHKNGEDVWIEASYNPVLNEDGTPLKVVKFASDITERKKQAARDASQIAAINRSQAVIQFSLDGKVTDVNDNFCGATGYTRDEILGKHHRLFVDKQHAESAEYQQFWQALGRGEFFSGEYLRFGKGGREVWIHATYNPVFDHRGKPVSVIKFAIDITEQKHLQLAVESLIGELSTSLSRIAGGDLDAKIDSHYKGNLGIVVKDLNATVDKLREVLSTIRRSADTVANAAREISMGNLDLQSRTESQGEALMETSATMEEMTETVEANAKNAEEASARAQEVNDTVTRGRDVSRKAVDAMNEISQSSSRVNEIISVIDDLAFQTNLLALNASVEAARAGDQGRGFAVVASEVRNLASRSAASAGEIRALIESSGEKVSAGAALVNQSRDALAEISDKIVHLSDLVASISVASQQQSQGIANINQAIVVMDSTNQQNSALVEETTAVSDSASKEAARLRSELEFFTGFETRSRSGLKLAS